MTYYGKSRWFRLCHTGSTGVWEYDNWSKLYPVEATTGDANGQIKIDGTNITVKGWNTAATYDVENTIANDTKLPTGAAVQQYVRTAENIITITLNSSAWSSTTTTVNGTAYYTATASVSGLTKTRPTVYCGSAAALPSKAEKDAFNMICYAAADVTNQNITFYAKILPGMNLTINIIS